MLRLFLLILVAVSDALKVDPNPSPIVPTKSLCHAADVFESDNTDSPADPGQG